MKKNLRSKILLCVLAGGVLAANTALAAEYTETQTGNLTLNNDDKITVDDIGIDADNGEFTTVVNGQAEINVKNTNNKVIGISVGLTEGNDTNLNTKLTVNEETENSKLTITTEGKEASGIYIDIAGLDKSYDALEVKPDLKIIAKSTWDRGYAFGLELEAWRTSVYDGNVEFNISSDCNSEIAAIKTMNHKSVFNGNVIAELNATADITDSERGEVTGIDASYGSELEFNKTVDITFNTASQTLPVVGVLSFYSNEVDGDNIINFNGETNLEINNKSGEAYGIYAQGGFFPDSNLPAYINFSNNTFINVNGKDKASSYAINVYADGVVNISKNKLSKQKNDAVHSLINGAIRFESNDMTDDSIVNINITGTDSLINSDVFGGGENSKAVFSLHDGAKWRPQGIQDSKLTELLMNNGVIEQNVDTNITIKNYSGSGDINFAAKNTDNNGVLNFDNTGDVTIKSAEAGSYVNLGVINNTINTLDSEKAEENLNAIAQKLTYKGNNLSGKVTVKEGLITPEASGDLPFYEDDSNGHTAGQGYVANVKQNSSTTTIDNIKNVAATAIVAWRQEDSTLSQRLGELRESDGGQGIWVRMSRGEFEYDGEYKNQYNFFQMGYDWAAGNWHYGAAVSHNDGQTTYTHGDGENRSTSLSLYGTWLGDKGHYADIVLKQGRLSNDFDIYTEAGHTSGDYDAWGTSLSGEYGMKVDLDGGWYVTPQAQLTLMRIGGEDYTTNNGIKVNQDSLESAVGRVGFEVGKRISDSGSIYAKASLLHDFAGSADTYLSLNGLTNSYHQDIGDTWCEAGIGFNYKTSENSYVYADVVKTFGGDVETPWQWNAGMRWTF